MVNKSEFGVVMSSGVFMLLTLACQLASSRHKSHAKELDKTGVLPLADRWKKVLSV